MKFYRISTLKNHLIWAIWFLKNGFHSSTQIPRIGRLWLVSSFFPEIVNALAESDTRESYCYFKLNYNVRCAFNIHFNWISNLFKHFDDVDILWFFFSLLSFNCHNVDWRWSTNYNTMNDSMNLKSICKLELRKVSFENSDLSPLNKLHNANHTFIHIQCDMIKDKFYKM